MRCRVSLIAHMLTRLLIGENGKILKLEVKMVDEFSTKKLDLGHTIAYELYIYNQLMLNFVNIR